jgi:hypothetical protein
MTIRRLWQRILCLLDRHDYRDTGMGRSDLGTCYQCMGCGRTIWRKEDLISNPYSLDKQRVQ